MSTTRTEPRPWLDTSRPPRERATALVSAMTLEQKISQLHGAMQTIDIYALSTQATTAEEMEQLAAQIRIERHVAAIDELGIPRFRVTNGPVGVGMGDGTPSPPATALPMTIALAAGFDPGLAHEYGDVIGSEAATWASTSSRGRASACTAPRSRGATSSTSPRTPTCPGSWASRSPRPSRTTA
jgi:beta-glucosidase